MHPREFRNATADEACEAAARLRQARRTGAALDLLWWWGYRHEATATTPAMVEAIAACLEEWVQQDDGEQERVSSHDLAGLVEIAERHSEHLGAQRLAVLKWQYRAVLKQAGSALAADPYLMIAQDPEIFVSLVGAIYRPASETPGDRPEPSEAQRRAASNADEVLHSWPPGTFNPGSSSDSQEGVNAEELAAWVHHARRRLAEAGLRDDGDALIGTALASSPADPDGDWAAVAVRELIEELESDALDNGLHSAIFNQRGVISRAPTDGGDQERNLAARYREQSQQLDQEGWPRTAAIFDWLASFYEGDAARQDQRAESVRRGLWG